MQLYHSLPLSFKGLLSIHDKGLMVKCKVTS
jgi:hypothetical protein